MAVPDPARDRPDLSRGRHGRLVRHLPDDPGLAPGGGWPLLALPPRRPPDSPPDLVPADNALSRGGRPHHRGAAELGRPGALDPALHPRPQRRRRAGPRGRRWAPDRLRSAPERRWT